MATLGWPLACALAAVILLLGVQWWYIESAAPGGADASIRAELQSDRSPAMMAPAMAAPGNQAMPGRQQAMVQQQLFIANVLLFSLGLGGMVLATRLNRRWLHAEQVRSACLKAMDAGEEGVLILRPVGDRHSGVTDFIVQDCNERGAGHAGLPSRDLPGRRLSELRDREWRAGLALACRHAMASGSHEEELETRQDDQRVCLHRRLVCADAGLIIMLRDISETRANQDILMKMAHLDALTGLPNRLWLSHFLPRAIESAAASASSLAVLFIDLDDFKSVNDTCGHDAGDALLVAAAGRLAGAVRTEDRLARLGGDEFVIVLAHADHGEIVQVACRIITALAEDFMLDNYGCRQTQASIGISLYPQDGNCAASLLRSADLAMYMAKSSGKGRYAFHSASPDRQADLPQPAGPLSGTRG